MRSIITAAAISLTTFLAPVVAQAFEMRFEAASAPEGVAVRGDLVWISDSGNDRVVRYRIIRD